MIEVRFKYVLDELGYRPLRGEKLLFKELRNACVLSKIGNIVREAIRPIHTHIHTNEHTHTGTSDTTLN